jgi:hypothetical protein
MFEMLGLNPQNHYVFNHKLLKLLLFTSSMSKTDQDTPRKEASGKENKLYF